MVVAGRRGEGDHPDLVGVHLGAACVGSDDVDQFVEANTVVVIDLDPRLSDRSVDVSHTGGLSKGVEEIVETGGAVGAVDAEGGVHEATFT